MGQTRAVRERVAGSVHSRRRREHVFVLRLTGGVASAGARGGVGGRVGGGAPATGSAQGGSSGGRPIGPGFDVDVPIIYGWFGRRAAQPTVSDALPQLFGAPCFAFAATGASALSQHPLSALGAARARRSGWRRQAEASRRASRGGLPGHLHQLLAVCCRPSPSRAWVSSFAPNRRGLGVLWSRVRPGWRCPRAVATLQRALPRPRGVLR